MIRIKFGQKSIKLADQSAYDYLRYELGYSHMDIERNIRKIRQELGDRRRGNLLLYYLPPLAKRFGFLDKNPICPFKMNFGYIGNNYGKVMVKWKK